MWIIPPLLFISLGRPCKDALGGEIPFCYTFTEPDAQYVRLVRAERVNERVAESTQGRMDGYKNEWMHKLCHVVFKQPKHTLLLEMIKWLSFLINLESVEN